MDGQNTWDGVHDDTSDLNSQLIKAQGVSFQVEGELRRRPGLTQIAQQTSTVLLPFVSLVTGHWVLVVTSSGTIEKVAI